jgi:hypothetical protein
MSKTREYVVREIHYKPGEPQVFAIRNSRDMLAKLRWEIDELRKETGYPVVYRAFNCAITAWSLADWLWEEIGESDQISFGNNTKFGAHCKSNSSALEICESLANSGKHRKRRKKQFNASIEVKTSAEVKRLRFGDRFGQPFATWKWEATVLHHKKEEKAVDVFERAYADWIQLIDKYSTET